MKLGQAYYLIALQIFQTSKKPCQNYQVKKFKKNGMENLHLKFGKDPWVSIKV